MEAAKPQDFPFRPGFSGIASLLSAIRYAEYHELGPSDVVLSVLTDSLELYGSRLKEVRASFGAYRESAAAARHTR
jgi:cysteine synthase A